MPSGLPAGLIPCSVCGSEHDYTPGTPRGQKCPACFRAMGARSQQAWQQARRQSTTCADCGASIPPRRGSGKPFLRCEGCRITALRRRDSARYYASRRIFIDTAVCVECDSPFPREGRGGPVPKRCPSCNLAHRRDIDRVHYHNRRARLLSLPYETVRPSTVYARDNWTCQLCREPIGPDLAWPDGGSRSIDHIRPLSRGGHHVLSNIQAAHLACNLRKACSYEDGENVA
jgi:5-methylcytosine-specific restriction endonuclease McrA